MNSTRCQRDARSGLEPRMSGLRRECRYDQQTNDDRSANSDVIWADRLTRRVMIVFLDIRRTLTRMTSPVPETRVDNRERTVTDHAVSVDPDAV